jgi:hypothetical protein
MKKLFFQTLTFVSLFFLASCKKDESLTLEQAVEKQKNASFSISNRGYLQFASSNELVNFGKKLFNQTSGDSTISSLAAKGFKNRTSSVSARNGGLINNLYS